MEKQTDVNIADRLQILVNDRAGGNAKLFAEKAGIVSVTLYNYLKGRVPKADALANICIKFNVNLNWLVSGIGSPYIGAENSSTVLDPDPEIADLLAGARNVLTSGNPIAFDALERNIRYFSHAIEVEKRLQEMEAKLADIDELKRYMLEMKRQEEAREKARLEEPLPGQKAA